MSGAVQLVHGPLDDRPRGDLLFAGQLLLFTQLPALLELSTLAEELVPGDPPEAEIEGLKERFRREPRVLELVRLALEQAGVDVARTSWDPPRLRVVPPSPMAPGARNDGVGTIGFHRDTWGSNVPAQVNWWLPLRPITAERTIAFYPEYWSTPLPNTSASWDLAAIRERRRAGLPVEDLPIVPVPTTQPSTASELRVVLAPGDLLAFSGAHLHASVPNTSDATRVSVELRTVGHDDLADGRGAPDLDGAAPGVQYGWFRSMADGSRLSAP